MVNANSGQSYDFFTGGFVGNTSTTATRSTRDFRNTIAPKPVYRLNNKTGRMEVVPFVTELIITIYNYGGGLNRQWGVARQPSPYYPYSDLDRYSNGGMDTINIGVASIPLAMTFQTASASASTAAMFSVNAFGTFAMGTGGVANASLFGETSATDPTLTALTFTPGSAITGLWKIHIASAGEYVAIGLTSGAVKVISDFAATPTSVGTMHALTNPCWGIIESPLNSTTPGAGTLLIYAGTSMYTLGTENAIGTAPTAALTNLPGGGRAVGICRMTGEPARAFWILPRTNLSASMYTTLGQTPCRLYSTNLEGTDLQEVKTPLNNVFYAEVWNETIVVSDGVSVVQVDGSNGSKDLGCFDQRLPSSNATWRLNALCVCNGILRTVIGQIVTGGSASMGIEEYEPATGSWHSRSIGWVEAGTGLVATTGTRQLGPIFSAGPGQAFSESTGYMHWLRTSTTHLDFGRQYVPAYGQAPFYNNNQTAGGSGGLAFETASQLYSVYMTLEGFEGLPFVVEEVHYMGDLALGNTSATGANWTIFFGHQAGPNIVLSNNLSAIFYDSGRMDGWVKRFDDNQAWANRLYYRLLLTQGSNTKQTPNAVPFQIKLLVFEDGNVRSPMEVRAAIG